MEEMTAGLGVWVIGHFAVDGKDWPVGLWSVKAGPCAADPGPPRGPEVGVGVIEQRPEVRGRGYSPLSRGVSGWF